MVKCIKIEMLIMSDYLKLTLFGLITTEKTQTNTGTAMFSSYQIQELTHNNTGTKHTLSFSLLEL